MCIKGDVVEDSDSRSSHQVKIRVASIEAGALSVAITSTAATMTQKPASAHYAADPAHPARIFICDCPDASPRYLHNAKTCSREADVDERR